MMLKQKVKYISRKRKGYIYPMNTETLKLSDYELGYLTAFSHQSYDDWLNYNREPEDTWYGIQVGDRMFDINLWRDEAEDTVYCSAYECYKAEIDDEHWTVNSDQRYFLWKREDA